MVPNGWEEKSLKDICKKTISYGIVQTGENIENGVPCVRVVDLSKNTLNPVEMIKTSDEIHQSYKKTILCEGELMMALRGEIGLVKKVTPELIGANITRGLARLSPIKSVDSDYLLWTLRSNKIKNELSRKSGGSALQEIALGSLRKVVLPIPPLPEQHKIAQILSTWDRGIATTEKLIDASKQQKKALMQQLLTGKKRLVDPETGKAFEGEWEEVKLDDLALYRRGSFPQPYGNPEWVDEVNGYPFIQVFDIDKNMRLKKATKTKISDAAIDKSVFIEAGTVIVSLQGSIGRVAITQYDAYVDRTVLLFQSFKRKMDTIYFAYAIKELFDIEKEKAPGGTIKTITKQVLSNFTIKVPTHYEQQKIASVLAIADKEIELLEAKLAHLKQEKKALMQQLLTGKRRVKVAETEAA